MQVRRSLKIRGRRKEKEKLPSGITADYSANFFAHLDLDRDVERDRGIEEVFIFIYNICLNKMCWIPLMDQLILVQSIHVEV